MAKLGLQLYTVRDEADRDFFGTVRKVARMGYDGIEFAGGIMGKSSAAYLKGYLDGLQIKLAGLTFLEHELENGFDEILLYCKTCDAPAVVFPWINDELRTKDGYRELAERFNQWGRRFVEQGIKYMYHIHGYEFEDLGGTTGMDILMQNCDPQYVGLEIDVYWVEWAGVDSVEFMRKYGSRSPYIHFKDMKDKTGKHDIEVGDGAIDMKAIALEGIKNDAEWFIVEQEQFTMPSLESAEISLKNLKRIVNEI